MDRRNSQHNKYATGYAKVKTQNFLFALVCFILFFDCLLFNGSAAMDHDTSNENLTFAVVSAQAGYLAYTSNLNLTVDRFTQTDVDMGRIAFVHSGR